MREFIFRGKRLTDGKWIEGDFILLDGKAHIYERKNEYGGSGSWGVDPATVGIVTGRTDSKGENIFNGDVVKVRFSVEYLIGEVVFGNGSFFLKFAPKQRDPLAIGFLTDIEMEVIGNIHDNPELLNPKQS